MIFTRCETGEWEWIGSEIVDFEISETPDPERRRRVQSLASYVRHWVKVRPPEVERAEQFEAWGFSTFDALHLACAESSGADVFLTTDDKLLRKSAAYSKQLRVRVENPLTWLREVS
jgi:predicted nucleic acid-binding protein